MGVTLGQHADNGIHASTMSPTAVDEEAAKQPSQQQVTDTASRQSVGAEHALRGVAMRARLLAGKPLPPDIDGSGHGPTTTVATDPHSQPADPAAPRTKTTTLATGDGVTVTRETNAGRGGYDGVVITTTGANDTVTVSEGPNGSKDVTINGHTTRIKLAPGQTLEIRTKGGDDTVTIDSDAATCGVTVYAGSGADHLTVQGGSKANAGWVQLVGEDGDDTIVMSGNNEGRNMAFGGAGNDDIQVNANNTWVTADSGDDHVSVAGNGNEVVTGGGNDDVGIWGNDNVVRADRGDGSVDVQVNSGNNTVVGHFGFVDRVLHSLGLRGITTVTTAEGASVDKKEA